IIFDIYFLQLIFNFVSKQNFKLPFLNAITNSSSISRLMDTTSDAKRDDSTSNRSRTTSNSAPSRLRPASSDSKTIDIVSMLTKAQNEYNQTKARTEPKRITDNAIDLADLVRPRPLRVNNSTGPPPDLTIGSSIPRSPEVEGTSLSVAALFASAGRQESGDNGNMPKRTRGTPEQGERFAAKPGWNPECGSPVGESLHAVLQRLISNTEGGKEQMERCRSTGMTLPLNGNDGTKIKTPPVVFEQETLHVAPDFTADRNNSIIFPSLNVPVGLASDIPLMSPMMFSSPNPKIGVEPHEEKHPVLPRLPQINPLTRDQLGQAL
uniref:Uncharacterized protein n=1 Tax=Strigamia maritima TaxID=126957 RepID=T1IMV4_STRMM